MADLLNVLFKKEPGRKVAIGGITLDATVEERHEYSAGVTDHPIEAGGFVTDHVFENPRIVQVTGEITDSPVQLFSVLGGLSKRSVEAHDQLKALYHLKQRVTLVTGLSIYTDMVMDTLTFPKNQQTGRRLQFTANFKETRFVSSEVVGVAEENADDSVKDKVGANKNVGRQETLTATDSQATKAAETSENIGQNQSLLADIFGAQ